MAVVGFEWGWDALVAVGTIALALGTFVLALSTRGAARASAEDVRAQWRPVLVPGASSDVEFDEDALLLAIQNVGRGAAYYVDAALGVDGIYTPADPAISSGGRGESLAVFAVDAVMCLRFDLVSDARPKEAEVLIDYADLNGRPYSTRILLDEPGRV